MSRLITNSLRIGPVVQNFQTALQSQRSRFCVCGQLLTIRPKRAGQISLVNQLHTSDVRNKNKKAQPNSVWPDKKIGERGRPDRRNAEREKRPIDLSSLIVPIPVSPLVDDPESVNVGEELVGALNKARKDFAMGYKWPPEQFEEMDRPFRNRLSQYKQAIASVIVVDDIIYHFTYFDILDGHDLLQIKKPKYDRGKALQLLNRLPTKGNDAYFVLMRVLKEHYDHLYYTMEPTAEEEEILEQMFSEKIPEDFRLGKTKSSPRQDARLFPPPVELLKLGATIEKEKKLLQADYEKLVKLYEDYRVFKNEVQAKKKIVKKMRGIYKKGMLNLQKQEEDSKN